MFPQLAQHVENRPYVPPLLVAIHSLTREMDRILRALWINLKQLFPRRIIDTRHEKRPIHDYEKGKRPCTCQASALSASPIFRGADDKFEEDVRVLLTSMKKLLEDMVRQRATLVSFPDLDASTDLPPAPQIFVGRDGELSALTDMFSQPNPAHAVLRGDRGTGKSSLALALLHRPEIVRKFNHRRFLVKCSAAKSETGVLLCLASALGLPDGFESTNVLRKQHVLSSLVRSPLHSLIVFDNLDATWDSPTVRFAVEDLLTELSTISTVSLLVTLRGTRRPFGPAYSKPLPAPLGPLSASAARQLFFAICDLPSTPDRDPLVDGLLQGVGFLPQAVAALAHFAQYEPLPFLLERYAEEGPVMLARSAVSDDG